MLVLSRTVEGHGVVMVTPEGHVIRVKLFHGAGASVRVGVDAPRSVLVLREELYTPPAPPAGGSAAAGGES